MKTQNKKRNRKIFASSAMLLISATLTACGGSSSGDDSPSATAQLQGTWERAGYGLAVKIAGNTVTGYDFTTQTCALQGSDALAETLQKLDGIAEDGTAFTLRDAPIGFAEHYTKTDALPAVCAEPIGDEATEVFEHIWHSFNDYYAFFNERQVDWLAQYDAIRDDVQDTMSETALFEALADLLSPIDDVHVKITNADEQSYSPGEPKGFFQDLINEFEAQNEVADVNDYISQQLLTSLGIIDSVYLDDEFIEAGGPSDDFFKWGTIGDDIGYLSIGAFILDFDNSIRDQLAQVETVIDRVLTDLADTDSLIIDVRLSPGGADPIALAIASRFADIERMVMQKQTRTIDGDGTMQTLSLAPSDRIRFGKPVAVLTSGFSASATEVFTLAMRAQPHVSIVGEPTIGALSDVLQKPLPNDWELELANEV